MSARLIVQLMVLVLDQVVVVMMVIVELIVPPSVVPKIHVQVEGPVIHFRILELTPAPAKMVLRLVIVQLK